MLPSIAALPLLMAYAGHTSIIIPKPLVPYVGLEILDLGKLLFLSFSVIPYGSTNLTTYVIPIFHPNFNSFHSL